MSSLKNVTDSDFQSEVVSKSGLTLVDFWAPWCGPCRALGPTLEQIANENGSVNIVKVNIDANQDVAVTYGVTQIPYMALFKDGKVVDSLLGNQPKSKITQMLSTHA